MMFHPLLIVECFSLLPLVWAVTLADTTPYHPRDHYLITCGSPTGGGGWTSDEDPRAPFATSPTTTTTVTAAATSAGTPVPYDSARIFWAPLTYSFPLSSPGPTLVRLYFSSSTSFNTTNPSQFFVSLSANEFTLLRDFSPYLAATNAKAYAPAPEGRLLREFYVTVGEVRKPLINLTFSPSKSQQSSVRSYGFINGIEVISVPDGLYAPVSQTERPMSIPYLIGGADDYESNSYNFPQLTAMEMIIRLNVGGSSVQPTGDNGLNRAWYQDDDFLGEFKGYIPYNYPIKGINYTMSTPAYTAPERVYGTMRIMGPYAAKLKLKENLTWVFEVDAGFDYLVRLHFCELLPWVNQSGLYQFDVYINGQMAQPNFDFFSSIGGPRLAMYEDFVVFVSNVNEGGAGGGGATTNKINESRVHLSVALHPVETIYTDAFLNGLEIFKLNKSDGSLAAPNPNVPITTPPITFPPSSPKHVPHHLVQVIIGGAVGFVVFFLVALAFLYMYCCKNKEQGSVLTPSSKKPTEPNWAPDDVDETQSSTAATTGTSSSVASSLPSDLCRRFTLTQIRIATCDFDESTIIGSGGFGKVYKGSIDRGATVAAIKRLNPTSTQGVHEFHNEIEMLSRLRHVHLVSLIGYCDDHGEMILVYEYMPRGTLRDHLMYKNSSTINDNTPLSWKQRLMICVGSARGLHYLHAGAQQPIIHRDVKSTNILLDDKWTAKVSDFGLSKVGPATGAGHVSTAVKGSIGYLDPEYYRLRQLTEKSDVYSFGVVLFEVLCGRQAMNPNLPKDQVNLALWARSHYKSGTLSTIVDPNLEGQIAPESLRKFGEVAEMCVRDQGSERPSMTDVVWALEFALQLQLTADQKITSTLNGGDHGGTTETDALTTSMDNFSQSSPSVGGSGAVRSFDNIPEATSNLDVNVVDLTSSGYSVFSEMMQPQGR